MPLIRTLLLLLPLLLAACGYGMGGSGQNVIDPEYRVMAISGVDNPTTLSWLEPRLRMLLRDELTRRGAVTWTDDQARADSLIEIKIIKYYRPTAVEGSREQTLRSNAIFTFSATVTSATDGHTIWSSGEMSQDWPFFSGQEAEADSEVTRLAIRRLADRMSENY
jgi:outer membrane lipopolysaccharide assembly protein LptE/RlpB